MLAVTSALSGEQPMELGTGSSVNSGSKCRRSLGPVWEGGRKERGGGRQVGISQAVKYFAISGNV